MKTKYLLIGIVALVFIYLAGAWWHGWYFEKRYNEQRIRINAWLLESAPGISIIESSYQRGFFNSSAQFVLEVDMPPIFDDANKSSFGGAGKPVRIVFEHQVRTGPWLGRQGVGLARVETRAHFDPASVSPELIQSLQGQDLGTGQTKVGYLNSFGTEVYVTPVHMDAGQMQLQFSGMHVRAQTHQSGSLVDMSVRLPYVLWSDAKRHTHLQVDNLLYESLNGRANIFFWTSDQKLTLDGLRLGSEGMNIDIAKLHLMVQENSEGDFISPVMNFETKGVWSGRPFQLSFNSKMNRLFSPAIDGYAATLELLSKTSAFSEKGMALFAQLEEHLADIYKRSPSFSINVAFVYDGKTADYSAQIQVDSISDGDLKRMPLPMVLMSKINGQSNFQASASLLTEDMLGEVVYPQVLALIEQGFLVKRGELLVSDFSYQQGVTQVNGKTIGSTLAVF
ncbi:DUF945 family protein [Saezia sanguinis]|uniref:DUF945 family protein n=1 Tax=Saezia sanguinis TaxID=1965230 RepID=UPI003068EA15